MSDNKGPHVQYKISFEKDNIRIVLKHPHIKEPVELDLIISMKQRCELFPDFTMTREYLITGVQVMGKKGGTI